jgi:hypothetical protein
MKPVAIVLMIVATLVLLPFAACTVGVIGITGVVVNAASNAMLKDTPKAPPKPLTSESKPVPTPKPTPIPSVVRRPT